MSSGHIGSVYKPIEGFVKNVLWNYEGFGRNHAKPVVELGSYEEF